MLDVAELTSVCMPVLMLGLMADAIKEQANGTCVLIKNNAEYNYLIAAIAMPIIIQKIYHLITAKCLNNWLIFPLGVVFLALSCVDSFKNNSDSENIIKSVMVKILIFFFCIFLYDGFRWITMSKC